jgi:BlaI family penicillinase repressor
MALPRLSRLELKVMEALWKKGALSVREIQETFPAKRRPAYTTVVMRTFSKPCSRRPPQRGRSSTSSSGSSAAAHSRSCRT